METITVDIRSKQEEKILRAFLDSLEYDYSFDMDETEYLTSSPANKKRLDDAVLRDRKGIYETHDLID